MAFRRIRVLRGYFITFCLFALLGFSVHRQVILHTAPKMYLKYILDRGKVVV